MADYADIDAVKGILELDSDTHDGRLADLNAVASRELEAVLGLRSGSAFGDAEADLTRTFLPPGTSDVLYVIPGIRSITEITVDGQELTEGTDYDLIHPRGTFWGAVYRRAGNALGWAAINRDVWPATAWAGTVSITGQWADQGQAEVDPLIVEAANVIVAGYFRKDGAHDGEVSGPEGLTFRPSNPWNDPRVKRLLALYGRKAA